MSAGGGVRGGVDAIWGKTRSLGRGRSKQKQHDRPGALAGVNQIFASLAPSVRCPTAPYCSLQAADRRAGGVCNVVRPPGETRP